MRIGIDATFLRKPGTGIGQVTSNFLEKLEEFSTRLPDGQVFNFQFPKNETVEFFIYTEDEFLGEKYPENFRFRSFLPRFWRRDDLIRKILWEKQVAREAQEDGCDIFLSLYQSTTIVPRGMRHIMVVHDLIPALFPAYQGNMRQAWYWRLVERALRRAVEIVAVSEATRNNLVEFGIAPEGITVIYPDVAPLFRKAVSPEENARVMKNYALTPGYIYHGGGLEIRKNTEQLLRAYALLVEKEKKGDLTTPLPLLVISGKIFPESNRLATPVKSLLHEFNLEERVSLLGFVPEEDLPALYRNALFFAYPSLYEGFGLPVLEAIVMGTPVLSADTASLPEVAGDAALYVDATSVEAIASGMERLLWDATLRHTLQKNASHQATHFNWEHFVKQLLALLVKK
ncbi:MAG: glycosyltransferase family 1 protein [Candidatus Moranbacteria bacterium]|nr:glycosyltransferase family 1 protein [Candidatus Moranbacteria bacterium]